jgi:chitinase
MRKYSLFVLAILIVLIALYVVSPTQAQTAPAWQPNHAYAIGDQVTYQDATHPNHLYKCIQAHTSLTGWEPPNVPALWQDLGPASGGAPTNTATTVSAPTKTNTAQVTATKAPTITVTKVPTSTATQGSGGGAPAWDCNLAYSTGAQVSYSGHIYKALVNVPAGECGWIPGSTPTVWQDMGTGGTGNPTNTATYIPPTVGTTTPGGHLFAPYIDVSPGSTSPIMQLASNGSGNKYYTLAFILGYGCSASWFGAFQMNTSEAAGIGQRINELRAAGGDVIVSFGGAAAPELANVCSDVASLQAQYQAVVSKYSLKYVDFDIEDFSPTAIDLRNKALKGLEAANPGLEVHYTLGVLESGFTSSQNAVLSNAASNGVRVDLVNIMAMDYGHSVSDMYAAAVSGAQAARSQLNSMGFSSTKLGITPMIGVNDSAGETFTLANAASLVSWAKSNNIALLAFWSVGRDNGGCAGGGAASASCSGVSQATWGFSHTFQGF